MDGLECSEVNYLDVINSSYSSRLDSDFFKKEAIKFSLLAQQWEPLDLICPKIKSGTTPSIRDANLKEGIALLKTNDIRNNIISPLSKDQFFYIDEETNDKMKSSSITSKDILINIVGATTEVIGRVSFVPENFIEANITQAMARLRIASHEFLPEYLFAFLLTSYAKKQTNRIARQTGQFNMNLIEVGTFRIWKASKDFQQTIAKIIDNANKLQNESQQLYLSAQQALSEKLHFSDELSNDNISIKKFSDSYEISGRLDAEYYQTKYDKYCEILKAYNTTTIPKEYYILKNSGSNYAEGKSEIGVIKTKQLTTNGINIDGIENFFDKATCTENKSVFLTKEDVVFASMGVGSLGKVGIFFDDATEQFVTDSTLRIFRKKEHALVLPEVLCVFLQSKIGQELIYRYVVGSTGIINIYDDDMAKIPIPVLEDDVQKNIAKKVQDSFSLKHYSKQLLNYAKQTVEMAIEQSEEAAEKWLREKVAKLEE